MIRSMSYLLMALMVIGFVSADYLLFTSSMLLRSFVANQIGEIFGDHLEYDDLRLRLGSILEIKHPKVMTAKGGPIFFRAKLAEVTLDDRRPTQIDLHQPELILTPEVLERLDSVSWTDFLGTGSSGEALPRVDLHKGSVRAETPAGQQILEIREGAFVPSEGGYWIRCRLLDQERGEWTLTGRASGGTGYRLSLTRVEQDLRSLQGFLGEMPRELWTELGADAKVSLGVELEGDSHSRRSRIVGRVRDATFMVAIAQTAGRKLRFEGLVGDIVVSDGLQVVLRSPRGRSATQVGGETVVSYTAREWGNASDWDLQVELKGFPLSELGEFLPADVTALWRDFNPQGTADFSASIGPDGPRVYCEVHGASFRITEGLRVEGLSGLAEYDGSALRIWRLANTPLEGDPPIEITGAVTGLPDAPRTEIAVTVRDLDFERLHRLAGPRFDLASLSRFDAPGARVDVQWGLQQADGERHDRLALSIRGLSVNVAPELIADFPREPWEKLSPQGDLTLLVDLDAVNGGSPLATWRGRIENGSFRFRDLPVGPLAGDLLVEGSRIHLRAERADGALFLRFDAMGHNGGLTWELGFEARDFPLGDLALILPEKAREDWTRFHPTGTVDLRGTIRKGAGVSVAARIRDGTFRIPDVMELDRLEGVAEFDGATVRIWRMTGGRQREGDPGFEITGSLSIADDEPVLEATVRCEDFPLARFLEIARSRVDLGRYLRPVDSNIFDESAGKLDMVWTVRQRGQESRDSLVLALKGLRLTCSFFPIPLEDVTGGIRVEGSRIEFSDVKAVPRGISPERSPTSRVVLSGFVDPESSGRTSEFRIEARDLVLDDGIEERLPEELVPLVRFFRLRGRSQVNVRVGTRGYEDPTISFVTEIRLVEASMNPGVEVTNIVGTIFVDGVRTRSNTRLTGHLRFPRAVIGGHRASDVYAGFTLGDERLILSTIRANLYGGELTGGANLSLDERRFTADFTGRQIDLAEYSASQRRFSERGLSGRLSFTLSDFRGTFGDNASYTGRGRMQVRDGVLWGIPVFLRLVDLDFTQIGNTNPDELGGELAFEIADERMAIPRLVLSDGSMTIVGRGHLGFDGRIYMVLKTKPGYGLNIPVINLVRDLFNELKGEVYAWEASGTFENPDLSWKLFPSLFPDAPEARPEPAEGLEEPAASPPEGAPAPQTPPQRR